MVGSDNLVNRISGFHKPGLQSKDPGTEHLGESPSEIPVAPRNDNAWKCRAEVTDQNGRFLLRGMVPGEYRIFSWDSDVDFDWYDAEQLKPYESKGVRISVEEGDRKTVQLTVIETENASRARQ